MQVTKDMSVVTIISKTLGYVNPRLIDHGQRVAILVNAALTNDGGYSASLVRDLTILALLHDVGEYKTLGRAQESGAREYDARAKWDHSLYGYLFIKYFSPISYLAPILLFYHVAYSQMENVHPNCSMLSQIIHLADKIDVAYQTKQYPARTLKEYVHSMQGIEFDAKTILLFEKAGLLDKDEEYFARKLSRYDNNWRKALFTSDEMAAYLGMIVSTIDFLSYRTVTHTYAMANISEQLARMFGLGNEDIKEIKTGAMLHDIGKTGIPVEILESTGKLTSDEMALMKTHVDMTEDILRDNVDDAVLQIAIRHHEKLNGSGYPRGLKAGELTLKDRIVAVADILNALCEERSYKGAFSKQKTCAILHGMVSDGQLDPVVVDMALRHMDQILMKTQAVTAPIAATYHEINREYLLLRNRLSSIESLGAVDPKVSKGVLFYNMLEESSGT